MKNTLQKFFLVSLICFLSSFTTHADDKVISAEKITPRNLVKPIRIGMSFGLPNIIGYGAEYVLPYKNHSFGLNIDYASYTASYTPEYGWLDETKIDITYLNVSVNYYIFEEGSGAYLSLGFCMFLRDLETNYIPTKYFSVNHDGKQGLLNILTGNAKATSNINGFPIKVGYKWIVGVMSIGLECGAILASIQNNAPASGSAIVGDISAEFPEIKPNMIVNFNDYKLNVHFIDDLPKQSKNWMPVLGLSIGIAF